MRLRWYEKGKEKKMKLSMGFSIVKYDGGFDFIWDNGPKNVSTRLRIPLLNIARVLMVFRGMSEGETFNVGQSSVSLTHEYGAGYILTATIGTCKLSHLFTVNEAFIAMLGIERALGDFM